MEKDNASLSVKLSYSKLFTVKNNTTKIGKRWIDDRFHERQKTFLKFNLIQDLINILIF